MQKAHGAIVSGKVKKVKPDTDIYHLLCNTYNLIPGETLFIDDREENVQAGQSIGIHSIRFENPDQLINNLTGLGLSLC